MIATKDDAPRRVTVNGAQTEGHENPTTTGNTVKSLPTTFSSDGFTFRQLWREGRITLFEKRKRPDGAPSFEVVRIRQLPARTMFGVEYPASEAMPASESWGAMGWTYSDLESARAKFRALTLAQDRPAFSTRQPVNRV